MGARGTNLFMLSGTVVVPKEGLVLSRYDNNVIKLPLRLRYLNGKKKQDGDKYAPSDFFSVSVWGRAAEWAAANLHQGDSVIIEGHFSPNNYTSKEGTKVYSLELTCDRLEKVGYDSPAETQPAQAAPAQGYVQPAQAAPAQGFVQPAQAAPAQGFVQPQAQQYAQAAVPAQGFVQPQAQQYAQAAVPAQAVAQPASPSGSRGRGHGRSSSRSGAAFVAPPAGNFDVD